MVVFFEGWKIWKRLPTNIVTDPKIVSAIFIFYIG